MAAAAVLDYNDGGLSGVPSRRVLAGWLCENGGEEMDRLKKTARRLRLVLAAAVFWLLSADAAWAQQDDLLLPRNKVYVVSYLLVFFCIALGLLVACRVGKRLDKPAGLRRDTEEEMT